MPALSQPSATPSRLSGVRVLQGAGSRDPRLGRAHRLTAGP
jgi:hypothetical protein